MTGRLVAAFWLAAPALAMLPGAAVAEVVASRKPPPLVLQLVGCPGRELPAFLSDAVSILHAELAPEDFRCCATLAVACDAQQGTQIDLRIADPITGRTAERRLDLTDVAPAAQPRTSALALAELLRKLRQEILGTQASLPRATDASADSSARPSVSSSVSSSAGAREVAVSLGPLVRWFPQASTTELGVGVLAEMDRDDRWVALGLDAGTAARRVAEGSLSLRALTLSAAAGVQKRWGQTVAGVGPEVDLARAWVRGQPSAEGVTGHEGAGQVVTLLGTVHLRRQLGGTGNRLSLAMEGAAGYVLHALDVRVDDVKAAGFSGVVFAVTLALRYQGLF